MTDKEIVDYAAGFRAGILGEKPSDLMCLAISGPLQPLLKFFGVNSVLVEVDLGHCNHFYLELDDGRVLDPTADQFWWASDGKGFPPVYLGKPLVIHKGRVGVK